MVLVTSEGGTEDADRLARDQGSHDAQCHGVAKGGGDPGRSADRDAGGEEGEDGHGEAGGDRPQCVLQAFGHAWHVSVAMAGGGPAPAGRLSRRETRTGTVNPSRTPATVAWIPEACTRAHVAAASGTRMYQWLMRFRTTKAKSPSGTRAASRKTGCRPAE